MHLYVVVSHIRPNEALHAYELSQLKPSVIVGTKIRVFYIFNFKCFD